MEEDLFKKFKLNGLEGEWILVSNNKLIAHDKDIVSMCELAEKYPIEDTIVTKVLGNNVCFY